MTASNNGSESLHEHERFAFLDEASHDQVSAYLADRGQDLGQDDKTSHFFVLPDLNLSVASDHNKSVIKLKMGQIGKGIGHQELPEVHLADPTEAQHAVELLTALTSLEPQVSEQFRHNYRLGEVEVAVKYTQTWGFHAELECLYPGGSTEVLAKGAAQADRDIQQVAGLLGIRLAGDDELISFNEKFKKDGVPRGQYSSDEIRSLYGSLFKLATLKRLPEQQYIDEVTIGWIKEHKPDELLPVGEALMLGQAERDILQNLSLPDDWFVANDRARSIHGQLHLARVATLASHVARAAGKSETVCREVFVAGLLHDIRRSHDKDDPDHAATSAEWFNEHEDEVTAYLGKYMHGLSVSAISQIIQAHDAGIDNVDQNNVWAANCVAMADALDRYRLPKISWWIKNELLQMKPSVALRTTAFDMVTRSEQELLSSGSVQKATASLLQIDGL